MKILFKETRLEVWTALNCRIQLGGFITTVIKFLLP
jgi:hypothetical protein